MRIGEYIIEPEWATNISYHIVRERRMMDLHDLLIDEISKKTDELINEHDENKRMYLNAYIEGLLYASRTNINGVQNKFNTLGEYLYKTTEETKK